MKIILNIIRKEFIQIFRNKVMLPFIFIAPFIQMILLVYAANLEMKEIKFYVIDNDLSAVSRRMVSEFTASPFYNFQGAGFSITEAEDRLKAEEADLVIHIPAGFSEELRIENNAPVQLLINAVNATKANLIRGYTTSIINSFNRDIRYEWSGGPAHSIILKQIDTISSYWYNPELDYKIFMLPGIIVILITIIGMFLTALNLVREKEL
ncbi:MAG: ABC transporter permease, partial [Bacteroidota bacterium]